MADNVIIESGAGFIPGTTIKADEQGKLSDAQIISIAGQLDTIRRALNGGLSFGTAVQSTRAGNFSAQFRTVRFVTANATVRIPHGLGRAPVGFIVVLPDRATSIYGANLGGWGPSDLYLASSVANALVTIVVF